jgi:oxygen-independent coproporphyrinogen-3 oxidase
VLIQTTFQPEDLYNAVHELIRMAYPKHDLCQGGSQQADVKLHMEMQVVQQQVALTGCIVEGDKRTVREGKLDIITSENNRRSETNRLIRRFAYDLLVEHKGYSINSYGILTGMRPVKLVHLLLDLHFLWHRGQPPPSLTLPLSGSL